MWPPPILVGNQGWTSACNASSRDRSSCGSDPVKLVEGDAVEAVADALV
jgi:hypothetical protein